MIRNYSFLNFMPHEDFGIYSDIAINPSDTFYKQYPTISKMGMTNKNKKARKKSKAASKARNKNRR